MNDSPRPKRPYNSKRRQAQALETRRQILVAARDLFLARGYTGATIEAIAQQAGVATETVFATFANKRTLLARVLDVAVGGDEQPIPLLLRPGPQAVLAEADPARFLQRFAQDISGILARVAPLFEVLRAAAKTEPDIAELLHNLLTERLANMNTVALRLRAIAPLRAGMDETRAAETIWSLTSPELFNLLVRDHGWARAVYAEWLGEMLVRALLPD